MHAQHADDLLPMNLPLRNGYEDLNPQAILDPLTASALVLAASQSFCSALA
jgi:hypothetical protein